MSVKGLSSIFNLKIFGILFIFALLKGGLTSPVWLPIEPLMYLSILTDVGFLITPSFLFIVFIVMYFIGKKLNLKTELKSVIFSLILGSLIGCYVGNFILMFFFSMMFSLSELFENISNFIAFPILSMVYDFHFYHLYHIPVSVIFHFFTLHFIFHCRLRARTAAMMIGNAIVASE